MNEEEFKAILKIIPTDALMAIRICYSVEKFREKHPRAYARILEALYRNELHQLWKEMREVF